MYVKLENERLRHYENFQHNYNNNHSILLATTTTIVEYDLIHLTLQQIVTYK
jgi:hypothetical protein